MYVNTSVVQKTSSFLDSQRKKKIVLAVVTCTFAFFKLAESALYYDFNLLFWKEFVLQVKYLDH